MNPNIARIEPSLIRSINARKRPGDIDLGLGEPTLAPDMDAFAAALEWTRRNGSPYSPNAGLPELRKLLGAYLAGPSAGRIAAAENVCVTVGSEEALYLAIKTVLDPARDEALIVEPCYLAYPKLCVLEGIRHRTVALDSAQDFRPSARAVLDALRQETRLLVINSPANPTGRVWPEVELRALAAGLAERGREVYVLTDEVYRELYHLEGSVPSIAAHHPQTLLAGSLSKSNALTGLRIGWLAGPPEVVEAAIKVHQFVNTAASTFGQRVAIEILSEPARLRVHRSTYTAAREALLSAAATTGIHVVPPEGAFYGFIRLPDAYSGRSLEAAREILESERVVTVPGRAFGESGEGWLRISCVVPPEVLAEGVRRIARWGRVRAAPPRSPPQRGS
jgi:aspartate/methionine/tyrosine aminotransferase